MKLAGSNTAGRGMNENDADESVTAGPTLAVSGPVKVDGLSSVRTTEFVSLRCFITIFF